MSDSPFFQFYPSDWLAGTRGLTAAETGIYITLIAMMYEAEGPVPNDPKRLARLCGTTPAAFLKAVDALVETGKLTHDERGFFNRRAGIEIEKRSEKRAAASASANARWNKTKQKQQPENTNASNSQCERNANQKPEVREGKEEAKASSKKKGTRLPADWQLPKVWGDWAVELGLPEANTRQEADKFRDYWTSVAGAKGLKQDWQATWRNWVRKAMDDRQLRQGLKSGQSGKPQWREGDIRTLSPTKVQRFCDGHWELCSDFTAEEAEADSRFIGRALSYA
ncbi:YdaU family protein [Paracoccus laeviglucosivorans]|uniref:Uncharacterized conserved protein YdaU, DUF1376 family n=1 Tax=Paracoccus laeviglucosivorans TaxID=1197861 RepID=A0A521DD40_9RHOB|nr:YdaU family protein [Paracoccus laeviglucosivorans]SMO69583.1 Uncharacterized conserved protein YdaU, DUF1376 family [Paracoccus laeviglucosivorans]